MHFNKFIDLFAVDLNPDILTLDPHEKQINRKEVKLRRVKARMARDRYRELCFDG